MTQFHHALRQGHTKAAPVQQALQKTKLRLQANRTITVQLHPPITTHSNAHPRSSTSDWAPHPTHHWQHKPSSVHPKGCNPIPVLVHHKATTKAKPQWHLGSHSRAVLSTNEKQRDFPQSRMREGLEASPWVCFERGWCRGGPGAIIMGIVAANIKMQHYMRWDNANTRHAMSHM